MYLKPLKSQVIVITGASSGIGLSTARMAGARGATVVLAARNENALRHIASGMADKGQKVSFVATDVSKEDQVNRLAQRAIEQHGRIDSWVNAAAAAIYGELTEVSIPDQRQLFEITYWGLVYGSLAAIRAMAGKGGALINIGSVLSEVHIPLQGPYVASKHAVKGFTDTLRVELEKRGVPISVTLIKPTSIDTPYPDHARTYFREAPITPAPRYAPHLVAKTILHACETPRRELYVGGSAPVMAAFGRMFPGLYDMVSRAAMFDAQKSDRPASSTPETRDNLYAPKSDGRERGIASEGAARETSLYTHMQMNPLLSLALVGAGLLLAGRAVASRRERQWMDALPWR
jgi:short-subunit dehydrogenase